MSSLDRDKLQVRFLDVQDRGSFVLPRRYTLTHSDLTGDFFLSIGLNYDRQATSGLYTRLMRDEVLAEWIDAKQGHELHVYCHVSGGLVFGFPSWRNSIFIFHMPQVLQAFRYGDRRFVRDNSMLDEAPVMVHFSAVQNHLNRKESWGCFADFKLGVNTEITINLSPQQ